MGCVINASNSDILQALVQLKWKTFVVMYSIYHSSQNPL